MEYSFLSIPLKPQIFIPLEIGKNGRELGVAIFAQPVDTRPSQTLMDQILPGPIKNRVEFGFLKKNPKRVRVFSKTRPEPWLGPTQLYIYIYIYML